MISLLKALTSLEFLPQIVCGVSVFMWDVLLPTTEDSIKMVNMDLITKDLILRGMKKTSVVVFEVPAHMKGKAYFMQFREILGYSSDHKVGEWRFDVMLCRRAFDTIPSMLDIDERMLPVIVTGRRPTCWKCGKTGHMRSSVRQECP